MGGKGGKGKGRHNNRYNKKQEPSAADLQAKADMEFARKLQAQINGTSFQGEGQRKAEQSVAGTTDLRWRRHCALSAVLFLRPRGGVGADTPDIWLSASRVLNRLEAPV